jgi:ATP-dependent Lon protease
MLDTLHPAVLDRMEIIEIAGYTHREKRHIMDSYLIPEAINKAGLQNLQNQFDFSNEIRDFII